MTKVDKQTADTFRARISDETAKKGWTRAMLAARMEPSGNEQTVSRLLNGTRPISAMMAGRLINALGLAETVKNPFLSSDLDEAAAEKIDRDTDRLLTMVAADPTAPPTAEALLITLAYEFAQGSHIDLQTAYQGLRGALQAAADIKAQGALPQNTDAALQRVMQEVARLNDLGDRDAGAAALDAAMKRADAEREAIHHLQLGQDRIRNDPASAADRIVIWLRQGDLPNGLFAAIRDELRRWLEEGKRVGLPFDLQVALALAKLNHGRAKGSQKGHALSDLGICHLSIGQRSAKDAHLKVAANAFRECLKLMPLGQDRKNWAGTQNNLGIALRALGDRQSDPALLQQAVDAYTAALRVYTETTMPTDWAMTQNNLGAALQALGERQSDPALLQQAVDALTAALRVRTEAAMPTDWAITQNNLGAALQALGERQSDSALLQQAVGAYTAALRVHTEATMPTDWAGTQNNLGIARRWLGALTGDGAEFDRAEAALLSALKQRTRDGLPFGWAQTQWNLADLALARFDLDPRPQHLTAARAHLTEARSVFAEGSDHQISQCDTLLARIAAAEASLQPVRC